MKRFLVRYGYLLLLALGIGIWYYRYKVVHELPWENFSLETPDGQSHPASDTFDFPCVVHFFASWCGPCMKEFPELVTFMNSNPEARVYLITDDPWDKIAKLESTQLVKIYRTSKMSLLNVHTIPTTYFFNQEGKTVKSIQGIAPWSDGGFSSEIIALLSKKQF